MEEHPHIKKSIAGLFIISGIFVILITMDTITGRVIGGAGATRALENLNVILAGSMIGLGIWLWFQKS